MWGGEKKMKKEEDQIKAYMGEGAEIGRAHV